MAWGEYPKEYNPRVHGTYLPSRWYGKPDTQFGQVKLAELPAWIGRRNKAPGPFVSAISRGWWRWRLRYIDSVKAGIGGPVQIACCLMLLYYVNNYPKYVGHKLHKYHW